MGDFNCDECGLPKKPNRHREMCGCIEHPKEARATINILRPGEMTFEQRTELAAWLREKAEYVLSSDHEERSEGASATMFPFILENEQ